MITFLVGVPKSGKSYYMVNLAESLTDKIVTERLPKDKLSQVEDFALDVVEKDDHLIIKRKQYQHIYHNIAGYTHHTFIKTDLFLATVVDFYKLFKKVENDVNKDTILVEKSKEINWFNSFIMIDECHSIMNNQSAALLWFLSYHAHLYIDLLFATQNLSLINYKYKSFGEVFIKATPSSLRLVKNRFVYVHYPTSWCRKGEESQTETLYANDKIFSLYQAGKGGASKNSVRLYVYILIVIALVVVYYGYSVVSNPMGIDKKKTVKEVNNASQNSSISSNLQKNAKIRSQNVAKSTRPINLDLAKNRTYLYDRVICRFETCYFMNNDFAIRKEIFDLLIDISNIVKKKSQPYTVSMLCRFDDDELEVFQKNKIIDKKEQKNEINSIFPTGE